GGALLLGGWWGLHGAGASRLARPGSAPDRPPAPSAELPRAAPSGAARVPGGALGAEPARPRDVARPAEKPLTPSRRALSASSPPVVPALAVDELGTPRERLLAEPARALPAARAAQLGTLSRRASARIAALEAALERATGAEREAISSDLAALRKNERYRARLLPGAAPAPTRPGASAGAR
ncbi:MAG: hypothetical protein OZ921_16135, partial [Sorangiineae bacterium]|nr:hypothetical protein [Sorangiineae bacterium]